MEEDLVTPPEAISHLSRNYSTEHFRFAVKEIQKAIAQINRQQTETAQEIARVRLLNYMDVKLRHASFLAEQDADLMAVISRAMFEIRFFASYVAKSEENAERFLAEADRDSVELYKLMKEAFTDVPEAEIPEVAKKRIHPESYPGEETLLYKLCSKFIHPSSLVMHDMEKTILEHKYTQLLAVKVVEYGWGIIHMMHDINWTT